jgi:hypothetical protein
MPQYRKLSTRTPESFDFNDLSDDFTRLTWVLLPLVSCKDGRGIDIPGWLIGRLYPLRQDVTPVMIESAMADFAARGMVQRYSVNGRNYYQIVNWAKYQGNTDKEGPSPYPAYELVGSYSGVGRELGESKSPLDADADADANVDAEAARPAPAPTPATFQPVPEATKKQKAQNGIKDPEPAVTTTAPAAVRMLHELTTYWPGEAAAPLIVESLGNEPNRETLARAVALWQASSNKPNNWLGMCDWYHELERNPNWTPQDRFKSNGNGNGGHGKPVAKTVSTPAPGSQPVSW